MAARNSPDKHLRCSVVGQTISQEAANRPIHDQSLALPTDAAFDLVLGSASVRIKSLNSDFSRCWLLWYCQPCCHSPRVKSRGSGAAGLAPAAKSIQVGLSCRVTPPASNLSFSEAGQCAICCQGIEHSSAYFRISVVDDGQAVSTAGPIGC